MKLQKELKGLCQLKTSFQLERLMLVTNKVHSLIKFHYYAYNFLIFKDCCVVEVPNAAVNVTNTLVKHGETVFYSCDLNFSSLFTTATCDNGLLDVSKIKCRL